MSQLKENYSTKKLKMSQDRQFARKLEDLLEQNVNVQSQQVPNFNLRERSNQKSLALQNMNSLGLFPRHSIERGIPLARNMLSEDMYMKQFSSSQQQSQEKPLPTEQKQQEPMILEDQQEWLVDQLDLPKSIKRKKFPQNTKNVLRNFGNAQNQYALYNKEAIKIAETQISDPQAFYDWIRGLKLENFEGFKNVWSESSPHKRLFRRVYKKICWIFYQETAIPYVLTSRMRDPKTKISHLKYVFRFLQGLKNPQDFSYFKKLEK